MTCLACRDASKEILCVRCRRTLRRGPDRVVDGGVLVHSAFEHEDAARALVHRLKYEAVAGVARWLAGAVVARLPSRTSVLVPIPRARIRHLAHGVDPGAALADAVGAVTGLPVSRALVPPAWTRRRAGPVGRRRGRPRYRCVRPLPAGAVLVDDVVTTGTTIAAAAAVCGARSAVTVTSSRRSALTRDPRTP